LTEKQDSEGYNEYGNHALPKRKEPDLDEVAAQRIEELKLLLRKNAQQHRETVQTLRETRQTVRRNYHGMVQLLIEVISLGNRFLGGHLKRTAEITWNFCRSVRLSKDICYLHYYGALLHDIGLVGRNPHLTDTPPEQMPDHELQEYRKHTIYGEKIISSIYNLKRTAAIIRSHHERFDGNGFPDQLQGTAITHGARVVRIVNDWDNMIYKYNMSIQSAVESIKAGVGTLYDPRVAEKFLLFIPEWAREHDQEASVVSLESLQVGMFLKDDIILSNGLMLVPKGIILNQATIDKIRSFRSMIEDIHTVQVAY